MEWVIVTCIQKLRKYLGSRETYGKFNLTHEGTFGTLLSAPIADDDVIEGRLSARLLQEVLSSYNASFSKEDVLLISVTKSATF